MALRMNRVAEGSLYLTHYERPALAPTEEESRTSTRLKLQGCLVTKGRHRLWVKLLHRAALAALTLFSVLCLATLLYTRASRNQTAQDIIPPEWWLSKPSWAAAAHKRAASLRGVPQDSMPTSVMAMGVYTKLALEAGKNGRPMRLKYPVVWGSAFRSHSGYGSEALSYILGLLRHSLVSKDDIWIMQKGDAINPSVFNSFSLEIRKLLEEQDLANITKRLSAKDRDRPLISVCHVFPDGWRSKKDESWLYPLHYTKAVERMVKHGIMGKPEESGCPCPDMYIEPRVVYHIGRSMFETEALPTELAGYTELLDEVWVPSDSSVKSFQLGGVSPLKLFTIPQGVDTDLFNPETQPCDLGGTGTLVMGDHSSVHHDKRPYRFLSVFKWERRKGWDILLAGYTEEFKGHENVELHIVTKESKEPVRDFRSYIRTVAAPYLNVSHSSQYDALPRVYVHHQHIPDSLFPSVYAAADALVLPTHGEGWGRPQIEAMSMGMPVISTNWSGVAAFLHEGVGYPLKIDGIVEAVDGGVNSFEWFRHQRWAQPSKLHLKQLMRQVYLDPTAAAAKGAAARAYVVQHFSLLAVARTLLAQLLRVQDIVDTIMARS